MSEALEKAKGRVRKIGAVSLGLTNFRREQDEMYEQQRADGEAAVAEISQQRGRELRRGEK